jgi:hypothetical protein
MITGQAAGVAAKLAIKSTVQAIDTVALTQGALRKTEESRPLGKTGACVPAVSPREIRKYSRSGLGVRFAWQAAHNRVKQGELDQGDAKPHPFATLV